MGNVDWGKCTFFLDQGVDFPDKSGASSLDHHCSYCYYWHSSWFSVFLESVKYIGPVKSTLLGCLEPASATSAGKENGELFTEEVIKNIIEEFSLSDEEAEKYMKMYW